MFPWRASTCVSILFFILQFYFTKVEKKNNYVREKHPSIKKVGRIELTDFATPFF